jgi:hypothetical protein
MAQRVFAEDLDVSFLDSALLQGGNTAIQQNRTNPLPPKRWLYRKVMQVPASAIMTGHDAAD